MLISNTKTLLASEIVLNFGEREKLDFSEKNLYEQSREQTNSLHIESGNGTTAETLLFN